MLLNIDCSSCHGKGKKFLFCKCASCNGTKKQIYQFDDIKFDRMFEFILLSYKEMFNKPPTSIDVPYSFFQQFYTDLDKVCSNGGNSSFYTPIFVHDIVKTPTSEMFVVQLAGTSWSILCNKIVCSQMIVYR